MMGGYGIAGKGIWFKKTFYMKPHSRITFYMKAYSIDSWDNEYLRVDADGKNIINEKF